VNGAHWTFTPFFNPEAFSPSLVFGALSIAVLSFLGFDAISTMAEETRGGARVVGRATVMSLVMVAVLFAVQTYLAALLVPGQTAFEGETATNEAFYTVADLVGGGWFKVVVAITVAIGAAIANALVAQAATSRLLFSMARDRQLPKFLAHVHPGRRVPERAVLLVSVVSLVLALFFVGQIQLLSSLGELRRAVLVPAAARVGVRLVRAAQARAQLRAAPGGARVRAGDHRLRAVERRRQREDRRRGVAAHRLRGAAGPAAHRAHHRAQGWLSRRVTAG
jgi:amino acid transporter